MPDNEQVVDLAAPPIDFDHYSNHFQEHPLEVAAEINELGVAHTPHHEGFYVIGRYENVRKALVTPQEFASGRPADQPELKGANIPPNYHGLPAIPAEADGKQHRDWRRAMMPGFTNQNAVAWRPRFLHWATVCIDEAIESGEIDFAQDLANPLAFIFAVEFLGLPVEDWRKWQKPAHAASFETPGTPELEAAKVAWGANMAELKSIVEERRVNPQDDFISTLVSAKIDGEPIPDDEVVGLCVTVMLGAVDTAAATMTNSLLYLDEHPEARAGLLADEESLVVAIEEWLRYYSPAHGFARTVTTDTELGGCPMHRGDRVQLSFLAANHDGSVFESPDEVKLDRNPNPHLAFGGGVHKCIGLHFARVEVLVGMQEILKRLPDYSIDREGVVAFPHYGLFCGHLKVPATFTPGTRLQSDPRP